MILHKQFWKDLYAGSGTLGRYLIVIAAMAVIPIVFAAAATALIRWPTLWWMLPCAGAIFGVLEIKKMADHLWGDP